MLKSKLLVLLSCLLVARASQALTFVWSGPAVITQCGTIDIVLTSPPANTVLVALIVTGASPATAGTVNFNGTGTRAFTNPIGTMSVPPQWLQSGHNPLKICVTAGPPLTITGISGTDVPPTPSGSSSGGAVGGGSPSPPPVVVAQLPTLVEWANAGKLAPNWSTAVITRRKLASKTNVGGWYLACFADDKRKTYYVQSWTLYDLLVGWDPPAYLAKSAPPRCADASAACFGDTRGKCL